MSNQIQITGGAKVRNLEGVITGATGVLGSVPYGGPNGVATLDSAGKVPVSQLPNSVMEFKGTWDAATNTPTLANGTGNAGDVYLCNVAGTVNFGAGPIAFAVGDYVVYSGSTWERSSGATGTVTSVAASITGNSIGLTGSPITTSGTLAFAFSGTSGQYINGAGNLVTFPTLGGYVPYTGATNDLDLGTYGLLGDYVKFNTTPSSVPTGLGTLSWDSFYRTLQLIDGDGDTTLQIGQEERVLVHNNTGATLTDGQVVYITGSTGELPSVSLADASSEATSAATLGVVTESIANGADGFITFSGVVHGLNTLAFTEGDLLWLSETAGEFTTTKPISPAHLVLIGYVIKRAGGNGSIFVKIQNTQELKECSDVLFTSLANNDGLFYESSTALWKNKSIATILGYTPANDALVVKLAGTQTITGEKTFSTGIFGDNGLYLKENGSYGGVAGYASITSESTSSTAKKLVLGYGGANGIIFNLNIAATRTYTFPNANGTIALTSDISYPVTSVFGRTGAVVATSGDYTTSLVTEGTNLYFTNARARSAISLTTTGTSGVATYSSTTGVLNIPDYGSALSGYLPLTGGTLTGPLVGTIATFVASTGNKALTLTGAANAYLIDGTASSTTGQSYGPIFRAGTNSTDSALIVADVTGSTYFSIRGDGESRFRYSLTLGNVIGTGTGAFYAGAGTFTGALIGTTATFNSGASSQTLTLQSASAGTQIWLSDSGTTAGYVRISSNANSLIFYANATQQLSLFSSGASAFSGSVQATSFIKTSGTSSQYLMADGSVSTLSNPVTGTGTTNYVPKFTGTGTIGNSLIYDNGTNVGIGTTSPSHNLTVTAAGATSYIVSKGESGQASYLSACANANTVGSSSFDFVQAADGTGYVYLRTNQSIIFGTNNTERMRITSGGNVLIGTTTDNGQKLQVQGNARFNYTDNYGYFGLGYVSGADYGFYNYNYGRTDLKISQSTGAATFSSTVRVEGSYLQIANATNPSLYINNTSVQWQQYVKSSNNIAFSDAVRDVLTLGYNGSASYFQGCNVGIGTTSPSYKLEVLGSGGTNQPAKFASSTTNLYTAYTANGIDVGYIGNGVGIASGGTATDFGFNATGNMVFTTYAATERMRITSGGNVLIGSTTDAGVGKLQVTGAGFFTNNLTAQGDLSVSNPNSAAGWFYIDGSQGSKHRYSISNQINGVSNTGLQFRDETLSTSLLYFASTGAATFANNITLGNTGSSSNAVATFQNSVNGYQFGFASNTTQRFVFINGGATEIANINGATGVYTPLSDSSKKKDFELSTIGLNAIMGLKPTLFRMKTESNEIAKSLGFIAQEVKEFIPQAYVENGDFIGLSDRPIIAALVKSIQELKQELDTLKNK